MTALYGLLDCARLIDRFAAVRRGNRLNTRHKFECAIGSCCVFCPTGRHQQHLAEQLYYKLAARAEEFM